MVQRVVQGKPSPKVIGIPDATAMDVAIVLPLIVISLVVGLYWGALLRFTDPAAQALIALMGAH
jgi:NADH:ubiquinone oxidoreductase subunit 4 (subunit M)